MDATLFQAFSFTNNWSAILPEIALASLASLLLLWDMFFPKQSSRIIIWFSILGQIALLVITFGDYMFHVNQVATTSFSGMILQNGLTHLMRFFFILSSILVTYLASVYFLKESLSHLAKTEFYVLELLVTAAMMLLTQSNHFVFLFITLETVTIGFYILVSYCRTSAFSLEAGLKYLILGALSSSILLLGIALLYGVAGNPYLPGFSKDSMHFAALGNFVIQNADNILVQVGTVCVIAGIVFKIGAIPFQIWIPDVYQGAPTPVTAFLAVASKAAGFIVLINLINGPFFAMASILMPLLGTIAGATILFGNIAALSQHNLKRMMGLSGIAHAGYLLLAIIAVFKMTEAIPVVVFYLFTYLLGSFAVFAVMVHKMQTSVKQDHDQELMDYKQLGKENPFLAAILVLGLGSLAGIPPLAGFSGKILIFTVAYEAKLYVLLGIAILGVVLSIYYYFGWIREIFFDDKLKPVEEECGKSALCNPISISCLHRLTLFLLGAFILILTFYQSFLVNLSL